MTAHKKKLQINLLPREDLSKTTTGRILTWLLSTFRIIVIITEFVVMAAFLSRFWLDAKNSDLDDDIRNKQAIIASNLDFENQFKDVQNRLAIFKNFSANNNWTSLALGEVTLRTPPDILLDSVAFKGPEGSILGKSANEQSIQQFFVNLKSDIKFGNVTIDNVSIDKNDMYVFSIKLTLAV